ncbi:hypothetical protein [Tritonibacter multivorans]|nr:hypothetical protein [Tritonibacter multivorans]MDA7422674.1 hypothetical protein [Tritonibacter multivorans]
MSAIPIVHLFAGLAIFRFFDPNALAAVVGIEWLSARVAALYAIGPHHAAFFLAIFPTLLFSTVYFLPAQRARIQTRLRAQNGFKTETIGGGFSIVHSNSRGAGLCWAMCATGLLVQISGYSDIWDSRWWGLLFPGVLWTTWLGAIGLISTILLATGVITE